VGFGSKELEFMLNLDAGRFKKGAVEAERIANKTRGNVEKPFKVTANVDRFVTSMARVGLALDGIKNTYRLVIGPARQLIEYSNIQEKADQKLIATLKTKNQYTEENFKLLKQQASAIQSVTTVGDEQSEMLQALALNLGATFDQVDEYTRGAIGLAESFADAGLNQETALKGIALAYQGNFTQLQRYIPALRTATDETEKMALLQQAMTDGFKQATDVAKSQVGQMEQFSNILGDVQEVGGDILKDVLTPILQLAKPVLEFIAGMDEDTRNATLAVSSFILVGVRVPGMLAAIRTAVIGLQASLGPAGWLALGIGAVVTAFVVFSDEAETAADRMRRFRGEVNLFNLEQAQVRLSELQAELSKYSTVLLQTSQRIKNLSTQDAIEVKLEKEVAQQKVAELITQIDLLQKRINILTGREPNPAGETGDIGAGLGIAEPGSEFFELPRYLVDAYRRADNDIVTNHREMAQNMKQIDVDYYSTLSDLGRGTSRILSNAFVNQWYNGVSAMQAFLDSFIEMIAGMVAEILASGILYLLSSITGGGFGFFAGGVGAIGKLFGFAEGGLIGSGDMVSSPFVPRGEDGLIAVQKNEYVMSRAATSQFLPILEAMNKFKNFSLPSRGSIPGYQTGGMVSEPAKIIGPDASALKEAVKDGFRESPINVVLTADNRKLYVIVKKEEEADLRRRL